MVPLHSEVALNGLLLYSLPLYLWAGKNMLLKCPGSRLSVSLESEFGALALLLSCHVSLHGLVRLYKPQFS